MRKITFPQVKYPLQWEYGFGVYGLGCYLWLWDTTIIIFFKEE